MWLDGVGYAVGGVDLPWVADGNLEDIAGKGRCRCRGISMSVSVVGGSELAGDGIFEYVFGDAANT